MGRSDGANQLRRDAAEGSRRTGPPPTESAAVVEWLAARIKEGEAARLAKRGRVSYNRLDARRVRQHGARPDRRALRCHRPRRLSRRSRMARLRADRRGDDAFAVEHRKVSRRRRKSCWPRPIPRSKPPFLRHRRRRAVPENEIDEAASRAAARAGPARQGALRDVGRRHLSRRGLENLPEAGIYEISFTLSGLKPEKGRAPRLFVYEKKLDRVLFEQDILAPEDKPITVTFRAHLPKGHAEHRCDQQRSGPVEQLSLGSPRQQAVRQHQGRPHSLADEADRRAGPARVSVSDSGLDLVSRAVHHRRGTARRDEYWPSEAGNLDQVRSGLAKLARRAFRRPVTRRRTGWLRRHREGGTRRGREVPRCGEGGHAGDPLLEELPLRRRRG